MERMLLAATCAAAMTGMAEGKLLVDEELPPAEGWSPIGFALAPVKYMELPGPGSDVHGLDIALTGARHHEANGLAFGAVGYSTAGSLNGLACSGIGNWCGGAAFGIHFASVINYADGAVNGVQLAMVNSAYRACGWQAGLVNIVSEGGGFQLGLWNVAESWSGFQLGLVNMAMNYSGIQMGLGNIIGESPLTACVLFNAWF